MHLLDIFFFLSFNSTESESKSNNSEYKLKSLDSIDEFKHLSRIKKYLYNLNFFMINKIISLSYWHSCTRGIIFQNNGYFKLTYYNTRKKNGGGGGNL